MTDYKIVDIQYFGNIDYYKILLQSTHVVFNQYELHQKSSFNNRCLILGANGPILLSVPLQKGRLQRTPLKDIRIFNEEKWQKKHWRSILSSYNASPWFSYYCDSMAVVFSKPFTFLLDWNLACIDWTVQSMAIDLKYELAKNAEGQELHKAAPNNVKEGDQGTEPDFQYQQVFESKTGFVPGLSILDLLFCVGPKMAISLLKPGSLNQAAE